MTTWSIAVRVDAAGDLVWAGSDSGPHLATMMGASDYEWWRYVRAPHLPALVAALGGSPGDDVAALVRERFTSDVDLAAFADEHGIPTEFRAWTTTDWS
jgi:hypothetical protein